MKPVRIARTRGGGGGPRCKARRLTLDRPLKSPNRCRSSLAKPQSMIQSDLALTPDVQNTSPNRVSKVGTRPSFAVCSAISLRRRSRCLVALASPAVLLICVIFIISDCSIFSMRRFRPAS